MGDPWTSPRLAAMEAEAEDAKIWQGVPYREVFKNLDELAAIIVEFEAEDALEEPSTSWCECEFYTNGPGTNCDCQGPRIHLIELNFAARQMVKHGMDIPSPPPGHVWSTIISAFVPISRALKEGAPENDG